MLTGTGELRASELGNDLQVAHANIGQVPIQLDGIEAVLWPSGNAVKPMGDPRVLATYFSDQADLHARMIPPLIEAAKALKPNTHGLGGKKVRTNAVWGAEPFRMLTMRALLFFCKYYEAEEAYVSDRWANIMEHTDYSAPHSHYESVASAVYFVEPGDSVAKHPFSGNFELMDPRIAFCCSRGPDRPTRGLMPQLKPGVMLMFPSEFLHNVHPYYGERPRITLAWNLCRGKRPEGESVSMEDQLEGKAGKVSDEK